MKVKEPLLRGAMLASISPVAGGAFGLLLLDYQSANPNATVQQAANDIPHLLRLTGALILFGICAIVCAILRGHRNE